MSGPTSGRWPADARRATVLAWHYHDDDVPGPAAEISLALEGLGLKQGKAKLQHFRIDREHSNAYTVWQGMGSPQTVLRAVCADGKGERARRAGEARRPRRGGRPRDDPFTLPAGVSLIVLEW